MRSSSITHLSFGLALALSFASGHVAARPHTPASSSASASAAPPSGGSDSPALNVPDAELPKLPELAPIRREEPDPESTKELEALLGRLVSEKRDIREGAVKDLDKIGKDKPLEGTKADKSAVQWIPAIHAHIQEVRGSLDRERAPALLDDARKAARKGLSKKDLEDEEKTDWLDFVLKKPLPKDEAWRDLTHLLAMIRMLSGIGTTPAIREILELRANFGEFLRKDLSRQIEKLGEKAVPALIEGQKHDATVVRELAKMELDRLGKVTPGEIVSMSDPDLLADTLRAFGHVRNEDAVDVCLSFANHDRRKVRDAAREAIAAIGEAGRWRLRDAYQDLTGDKVDKSVPWDILARRIFAIYDKSRVAELWTLFTTGLDASKSGKHASAVEAFDKVLARDPLFDRRSEMARSYFEVATTIGFDKAEDRLAMLRKARRLDPSANDGPKIDAEIAYTEAKVLIAEGKPDRFLLERAVELDPDHKDAKALLDSFEKEAVKQPPPPAPRYALAGGIAGATVLLFGLVGFLWRRKRPAPG